jgi:hypothetical protein
MYEEVSPPPPPTSLNFFAIFFKFFFLKMVHALQAWAQAKKNLKTEKASQLPHPPYFGRIFFKLYLIKI